MKKSALLIFAMMFLPLVGQAQNQKVHVLLGSARIGDFEGRRFVDVKPAVCGVTSVQVRVENDYARIDRLRVRFGDLQEQTLNLRDFYAPGTNSGWKDLDGSTRCITGFLVDADTPNNGRNALISLEGMKEQLADLNCAGQYYIDAGGFRGQLVLNQGYRGGSVTFDAIGYEERIINLECRDNQVSFTRVTTRPPGAQDFRGQLVRNSMGGKTIRGSWSGTGGSGEFSAESK